MRKKNNKQSLAFMFKILLPLFFLAITIIFVSSKAMFEHKSDAAYQATNNFITNEQGRLSLAQEIKKIVGKAPVPIIEQATCSQFRSICTTEEMCTQEGGYSSHTKCNAGGSTELICCTPRKIIDENRVILESQCSDVFNGSCTTNEECKNNNGVIAGTCWDGGITTVGVCCVKKDTTPPKLEKDPQSCQYRSGYIGDPRRDIFCRDCAKYCSTFVKDASFCTNPAGSSYSRGCCDDNNFDGKCDGGIVGYCCKTQ
jgi:hypothetical protein